MSTTDTIINALKGNGPKTPYDYYGGLQNLIGRPYSYLESADPNQRSFVRHMMPSSPLVMIRPGRVRFREIEKFFDSDDVKKIFGLNSSDDVKKFLTIDPATGKSSVFTEETGYGVNQDDLRAVDQAIQAKQKYGGTTYNFTDMKESTRYFDFDPALKEYSDVVSTLSAHLYSRLAGDAVGWMFGTKDIGEAMKTKNGFMTFWADNASSVSESAASDVGPSALAGIVKGISDVSRQAQFFLKNDWKGKDGQGGVIEDAANKIRSTFGDPGGNGIRASLGDAVLGLNPLFPEVWKDSSFGRSYNLSFKFYSPYGAPGAVFQNVLLPFTYLLSLVLPVMRGPTSYTEPFIFQLDCPGYFACDLGICTDFSFVKGGSENLWTVDGLPRAIDVNLQVKDLYPTLMSSHNTKTLMMNIGLATFLDNLVGISLTKAGENVDLVTQLRRKVNDVLFTAYNIPEVVKGSMSHYVNEKLGAGKITGLFGK